MSDLDPVEVEALSARLAAYRHDAPRRPTPALAMLVVALVAAIGLGAWWSRPPTPWAAETLACSGCVWAPGTALDTTGPATARIADRGQLSVTAGTRLLRQAGEGARLVLDEGHLEVFVDAEAEWLTVALPGVTLVDLGCAFVVDVDRRGHGVVAVGAGEVALRSPVSETVLPAGTRAATWPDGRTGLAVSHTATADYIALVDAFDQGGPWQPVVDHARLEDAITLWHLLDRAPEEPVRARLAALLGAEAVVGVERADLLATIIGRTL